MQTFTDAAVVDGQRHRETVVVNDAQPFYQPVHDVTDLGDRHLPGGLGEIQLRITVVIEFIDEILGAGVKLWFHAEFNAAALGAVKFAASINDLVEGDAFDAQGTAAVFTDAPLAAFSSIVVRGPLGECIRSTSFLKNTQRADRAACLGTVSLG